jgi:hypothetical protein
MLRQINREALDREVQRLREEERQRRRRQQ